ncbi:FKBP-type peptidyl-prolyl cis-trans isomerase [Roseateles sp. BYS180W]|uniref:Peptidyl-prolyl cis-trans isomerase n=1 Tax=Roseateles rivi TaxID=3299028 RepID=A0ABW7FTJ4_9BURK
MLRSVLKSRRALLGVSMGVVLALSGCGGGSSSDSGGTDWATISGSSAVTTLGMTDVSVGTGATVATGQTVTVHYTGWLYDKRATGNKGSQFDSSVGKTPFAFPLGAGRVIAGWDQGVQGMKVGGKRTLVIPASLGYGAQGAGGGAIPPNAALIFDVEVLAAQ